MSTETYALASNRLVIPENTVLRAGDALRRGVMNVGLDLTWPDNVPANAVRIWAVVDESDAVTVTTSYFLGGHADENIVRRDVAVLLKPPEAVTFCLGGLR